MRIWHLAVVLALVLIASGAFAQAPPAFPPGAQEREAQFLTRIGPQARAWIGQEVQLQTAIAAPSEQGVINDIRSSNAILGNLNGADVEALCFLVLMAAAKSADQDLRSVMAGVKSINAAKDQQHAGMAAVNKSAAAKTASVPRSPQLELSRGAVTYHSIPKVELDAAINASRGNLNSLNELGETESLRLQMAMDRMSKIMTSLSNIMNKISDTNAAILQNMK
jgi:hypothetical protein